MYLLPYTTETTSLAFGGWRRASLYLKDSANLSGGNTRKVTVGFARAMDPME